MIKISSRGGGYTISATREADSQASGTYLALRHTLVDFTSRGGQMSRASPPVLGGQGIRRLWFRIQKTSHFQILVKSNQLL